MPRFPESRQLGSTVEVLNALGGVHAVTKLTKQREWKNVEGWKRAKTFPSRYFLVMNWALKKRRMSAPPSLWGMVTIPEMEKAAA